MAELLEGTPQMRRHENGRVEILTAPPRARISLEFLTAVDPALVKVAGNTVTLAGQVAYRVVGWDPTFHCLLADLDDDRRPGVVSSGDAMSTANMPGLTCQ